MNLPCITTDTERSADDLFGTVYKKNIGQYIVHTGNRVVPCALSTRLRKELIFDTQNQHARQRRVKAVKEIDHSDPVAVGDEVSFSDARDGTGVIQAIYPRRNQLTRRTPGTYGFKQVIAANIDQVVPVFAISHPEPHWAMLDRYLASAESRHLPALICLTKFDLLDLECDSQAAKEIQTVTDSYRKIGYPVIQVSAYNGSGLAELQAALKDKVSVVVGKSGVGKTSLLNTLQPGLGLRTEPVSPVTGKGKHATSWLELFPLECGGAIVDTPGMREYGLWEVDRENLPFLFLEMRPWIGKCRFGLDCQHDEEPGCAIRQAVMTGDISPRRYQSYLRLREG